MAVNGYKFIALTGGGAGSLDSQDGTGLNDGDVAIVMTGTQIYFYQLDDDSGAVESAPDIIAPDSNGGNKRWILQRVAQENSIPIGSITAWVGGYFANGANGGFVNVLGNDVAAANSYFNGDGWYVCDGSELNLSGSPIYNGTGRYLPQLTDQRFLMGDPWAGQSGGQSLTSHYHNIDIPALNTAGHTLSINEMPSHTHQLQDSRESTSTHYHGPTNLPNFASPPEGAHPVHANYSFGTGGGAAHNHYIPQRGISTNATSNLENRPRFLTCLYIQKVI